MKKLLSLLLTIIFLFSVIETPTFAANSQSDTLNRRSINISDVIANPDNYPNIKIIVHKNLNEFIERLNNDSNLSSEQREKIISKECYRSPSHSTLSYTGYVTIYDYCSVTSSYVVRPYFYCRVTASDANIYNITALNEILNANIDRNHNGVSKEFTGQLYYNLESYNTIYWDLNGSFYETGTTEWDFSASAAGIISFTTSGVDNFYRYCHREDRLIFNI